MNEPSWNEIISQILDVIELENQLQQYDQSSDIDSDIESADDYSLEA